MKKTDFVKKVDTKDWANTLNHLQEVAEESLEEKDYHSFLKKQSKDMKDCEGMDCLYLNGQAFDWKEFSYKGKEIVLAFLDYFTEPQLDLMQAKL